jgi:hypothetical protein
VVHQLAEVQRCRPVGVCPHADTVGGVLTVHFLDTEDFQFGSEQRTVITGIAAEAERLVRRFLPLADHLHLLVETGSDVLETGDHAHTIAPHLIRWAADPARVMAVARAHLAQAFAHEAYHAARFRELASEAGTQSWAEIAIGEGLATAFARDVAAAHEPWAGYDPEVICAWAAEFVSQDPGSADLSQWKFRHPDGRQWIAYRVGTWIVDAVCELTGKTPADLVWIPAAEIAAMSPLRTTHAVGRNALSSTPSLIVRTVNLDCADAPEMARFYSGLLGWQQTAVEPDWVLMRHPDGGTGLSFQQTDGYQRPTWPEQAGRQQKMIHLEVQVTPEADERDYSQEEGQVALEAAVRLALSVGGTLAARQTRTDLRVILDPAGHPLCLFLP